MKNTKVISGFPAVGKSYLFESNRGYTIVDSDSSIFSWIEEGIRHPMFPQNYVSYIKDNIGKVDYILVSSHDVVRQALRDNNINYTVVYPSIELMSEYTHRYLKRGDSDEFISFIRSYWETFITDIEDDSFPELIRLKSGEFLSDVLSEV